MLLWLLVQLAGLALAAFRVPFAAAYPQPAELQAVRLLLVFQFTWASLAFPSLLRSWQMTVVASCSACVTLALAAALAGWSMGQVIPVAGLLTVWLAALTTLRAGLSGRTQLVAAALVGTFAVGGALVGYLQAEFAIAPLNLSHWAFGPMSMAVSSPKEVPPQAWWEVVGIGAAAAVRLFANRSLRKPVK